MQLFLEECRTCMQPEDHKRNLMEATRQAGATEHIVEWFLFVLADLQVPIPPSLRRALDAMLESLSNSPTNHTNCDWEKALHRLNYGKYWTKQYGYA